MTQQQGFHATENFDLANAAAFLRQPEIYWPLMDAGAPEPEHVLFENFLTDKDNWSLACCYNNNIIGVISLVRRNSVCAEVFLGFHPNCRGQIALNFCRYAVGKAFTERGYMKLFCSIPSDNRRALMMAAAVGFVREGVLTKAVVRGLVRDDGLDTGKITGTAPGLYDVIVVGLRRV